MFEIYSKSRLLEEKRFMDHSARVRLVIPHHLPASRKPGTCSELRKKQQLGRWEYRERGGREREGEREAWEQHKNATNYFEQIL